MKKATQIKGLIIISIARFLVRFLPFKVYSINSCLFSLFKLNKSIIVDSGGFKTIVIPEVASCWRNVVTGREFALQYFLRKFVPEADGFLDCGAHLGYFSCFVSHLNKKVRVLAVEPLPECISYLGETCHLNNFDNIEIINGVLSPQDEMVDIEIPEYFCESSRVVKISERKKVHVQGYSLDGLLQKFKFEDNVIVKIDIEGYELAALNTYLSEESKRKIIAICIEVHLCYFPNPWRDFCSLWEAIQAWFVADWFMAKPRCLQGPFERYWNRVMQKGKIIALNTDLVKNLINNKKIGELQLFGIKRQ